MLTADEFEPHTVTVLDVNERPIGEKQVVSRCKRCARSEYARSSRRTWWEVVSPSGVEHLAGDYGETECGIDGTGTGWWWAL